MTDTRSHPETFRQEPEEFVIPAKAGIQAFNLKKQVYSLDPGFGSTRCARSPRARIAPNHPERSRMGRRGDDSLKWLRARRVAVLKGGWSSERSISLKTGKAVEAALRRLGVRFVTINVNRNLPEVLKKRKIQFAFLALHGPFGEDGRVQSLLDFLRIPYSGPGPLASAMAMDKDVSKKLFVQAGVPTPPWVLATDDNFKGAVRAAEAMLERGPVFIKPADQGSAVGVSRVNHKREVARALRSCFKITPKAIVEKFIPGRELTVGVLGGVALPVIEICPSHTFYDFYSKYARGGSRHICPAEIPLSLRNLAQKISLRAARALDCSVVCRVDLMCPPSGRLQVLEINTIPGMTDVSLFPEAARAAGIGFDQLVLKIVELSLEARATEK